ncbi:hypothetical protein M9H77_35101 [Catharanthus roseus]|uniref:Uncharacterized protein n=1 Tax=Catharanthus roseus TaxID=4058 RepID=A0ACB9ZPA6_CATRO|nr:hypothetical protein M9H77_35101 [Catharanthus roseus]
MNQDGQGDEEARARRIKEYDDKVAHGLMIAIEESMNKGLKFKNEGLDDDGNPSKLLVVHCVNLEQPMEHVGRERNQEEFRMSMDGHLPSPSHQEGTSDPTWMNLKETLRSIQQSIEGLARQFQGVARDVEELKKGKKSATIE